MSEPETPPIADHIKMVCPACKSAAFHLIAANDLGVTVGQQVEAKPFEVTSVQCAGCGASYGFNPVKR